MENPKSNPNVEKFYNRLKMQWQFHASTQASIFRHAKMLLGEDEIDLLDFDPKYRTVARVINNINNKIFDLEIKFSYVQNAFNALEYEMLLADIDLDEKKAIQRFLVDIRPISSDTLEMIASLHADLTNAQIELGKLK